MDSIGIPFNKPFLTGKEMQYIYEAVQSGQISGNGSFTKRCHEFFETRYGFKKTLLTTSCTDALEMAAMLLDIGPGDEVIVPSFTFVSSALAFARQGAKIVFADSTQGHPNLDIEQVASLITPKTKAIVVVHYAGVACDMDALMALADEHGVGVIEDAAQSIDSTYKGQYLGGIGHLGCFSFHETKNIISGEGGMLAINDERYIERAEIIWEKGTNRSAFFRGEINKYGWVDTGSSFLPSDVIAAFLYAQLETLDKIQTERKGIWERYYEQLKPLEDRGHIRLPHIPDFAVNNAHMFYILCEAEQRSSLIKYLKERKIHAVFHYLSLHKSPYYKGKSDGKALPWSDYYTDSLLRLPFFLTLTIPEQQEVISAIHSFFD